ncbi:MAG: NAD(P)H-hydrate dehydratase [Candidatus Binatia bacterium]
MKFRAASASVLGREAMRELDARTINAGTASIDLMEWAGEAIADALADVSLHGVPLPETPRLLVLAGPGNNGGDGFVVARLLAAQGWLCTVALAGAEPEEGSDAAANLDQWRDEGGTVIDAAEAIGLLQQGAADFDLGLDAIFGTGLARPVSGADADFIQHLNKSGLPIVAADIPSGLCSDTGCPLGIAVRARATVTIGAAKPGLFLDQGPNYGGRVRVADIGLLEPAAAGIARSGVVIDRTTTAGSWPRLVPLTHKGSRGHVLIVAGSRGKTGAAVLTARGALRAGAGLVTVACVGEVQAAVAAALPEAMTQLLASDAGGELSPDAMKDLAVLAESATSIVVGPGLGTGPGADAAVALLLGLKKPLVLDADALNIVSAWDDQRRHDLFRARTAAGAPAPVLTPHPGEMGRLVNATNFKVQLSRVLFTYNLAKELGAVVVLKGAATIVADGRGPAGAPPVSHAAGASGAPAASPAPVPAEGGEAPPFEAGAGDGGPRATLAFNLSGNPGMACAGMGDVLSGICGAMPVRLTDPFESACLAVYAHAVAGDVLVRGGTGFLASELADALPAVLATRHPR